MIIYLTRHGQPAIGDLPPGGDHEFPLGDPGLTDLGLKQATYLGEFLRQQNFKGKIYSSPYRRTLYTAEKIAELTGNYIYPEVAIQECVFNSDSKPVINSLPLLRQTCNYIAASAELYSDWLFKVPEDEMAIQQRVKPFIDKLFTSNENELLLVGHGASVCAVKILLFAAGNMNYIDNYNWNCSLSKFIIENGKTVEVELNCATSFMPPTEITSNLMKYSAAEV
jgi:broad specificity phosphatase PhoE